MANYVDIHTYGGIYIGTINFELFGIDPFHFRTLGLYFIVRGMTA